MSLRKPGVALFTVAVALSPASAFAQSTQTGWALDRYEPAPVGDVFFVAQHPWYSSTRVFAVGLTLDQAVRPLVFRDAADGSAIEAVSGMLTGHLGAMVSFADRVGVGLSFPVSFTQSGVGIDDGTTLIGPAASIAPGDLRASVRARLLGHADRDGASLHVGVQAWIPIGLRADNMGDEGLRLEPQLIAAGRGGPLRWSTTLGFLYRPSYLASNVTVGSEVRVSAGLGVVFLDERLTVGPEVYLMSGVSDPFEQGAGFFSDGRWGGEAIVGAHYLLADALLLGLGGGAGFGNGYGIPAGRVLVSLAYAPTRRAAPVVTRAIDFDDDGVGDDDDRCRTTPAGVHPDPAAPGCPLADSDGDGVYDGGDQCFNEPQGANPDPAHPGCPLRDRDSDGVFDGDDACPQEAPGPSPDPTRRGCPANDRDRDGVFDHLDQCPDAARAPYPDPNRNGCALPDADHDMVPEPPDACPGQAGVPSREASRNGCPNALVQMSGSEIRIAQQVLFPNNRDRIRGLSFPVLEAVADVLRGAPLVRRVSIEGHTDDRSTPARNLDLSQRRADAVMRWLIQNGVAAGRLEAHGFGQTRPVAPNDTEDNRARNRRVEFHIVDPSAPGSAPTSVVAPTPSAPVAAPVEQGRHGRRHGGRRRRR